MSLPGPSSVLPSDEHALPAPEDLADFMDTMKQLSDAPLTPDHIQEYVDLKSEKLKCLSSVLSENVLSNFNAFGLLSFTFYAGIALIAQSPVRSLSFQVTAITKIQEVSAQIDTIRSSIQSSRAALRLADEAYYHDTKAVIVRHHRKQRLIVSHFFFVCILECSFVSLKFTGCAGRG
jgi:hypothetical protein